MKIFTTEQTAFAVFFNTTTATNISPIDIQLLENNCEEADPLLILHSLDVRKQNPYCQLKIVSLDRCIFAAYTLFSKPTSTYRSCYL